MRPTTASPSTSQRRFARLVRVDDGVFTTLAEDLALSPPSATWYTLSVERRGDSHTVRLNGSTILTATDDGLGAGAIALYCYGMDDGRFDDVFILPSRWARSSAGHP